MSRLARVAAMFALGTAGGVGVASAQPAPVASAPPYGDPGNPSAAATAPGTNDPGGPPPTAATEPGAFGLPAATTADPGAPPPAHDDDMGDQDISAQLGLATGGRVTPGGLRIAGHYLYQLSDRDWFDGAASFTFGSGGAACFRDRSNALVCDHGLADGTGVEVSAGIRRLFAPQGQFRPFVRLGIGLGAVRFSGDDVSGVSIPLHGGGGVRVKVAPSVAVIAEGELVLGFGDFNHGLGSQLQLGLAVTAGAEFRLK